MKQQYKRHFVGAAPGMAGKGSFNLEKDPREEHPMMAQFLWAWGPFDMMKKRHDNLNAEYPFTPTRHGVPFEGIENLRPESIKYQETVKRSLGLGN